MLRVVGWAYDPDNMNSKVRVHVYIGGEAGNSSVPSKEFVADKSHSRYNGHGFDGMIENVPDNFCGKQTVRIYALDSNKNGAYQAIGSANVFIPYKKNAVQGLPAYTNSALTQRNGTESVYAGDELIVWKEEGNAFFVRYPAGNTTKERWVSKDVFEQPNIPQNLQNLINTWNNKTWKNHTYLSDVKECKEFASYIFNQLYGVGYIGGGSVSSNAQNYLINLSNPNRVGLRGYKTSLTASSAQQLFSSAQAGDFVQIRRRTGGPHSGIFVNLTGNGIVLFEANADGKNSIRTNTYSYSDLASRNYAMSLYYAK